MGGSSGGTQTPVTTTATKDPWSGAQPYLSNAMASAQNLYNANVGYQPYTGVTQAPVHPWQSEGIGDIYGIAKSQLAGASGMQGVNAAQGLAANMISNEGLNAGLRQAAGQYGNIYSEASGQQNPYLQAIIDTSNRRIADQVGSRMSGSGRYGSGAMQDLMARSMAEAADPLLAQDYAQRQQLRMQATGALGDIYGQGLQRAGQWSQLVPQLAAASYMPAQQLQDVGNFYTQYAQQALNDDIKKYNAQQAYPWEQLNRFNAILQGMGGLGGTTVTSSPGATQPSTTQRLLGGALAGGGMGSMFGPVGMGIGALGGGLLGMM